MSKTHVRYIVDDVPAAVEFYTGFLGFEVQMHPAPGFACLVKDQCWLFLNQPGVGGAGQKTPDGQLPEPGGWNRIQLIVDDLESLNNSLQSAGVVFRNEITEGKGGRQVLLEDPSGNPVELFEPKDKAPYSDVRTYKPEGYSTVTPYLAINNAEALVVFLKKVFEAEEHRLIRRDDGSIMHSEYRIGDSIIMIGDVQNRLEPSRGMLKVYVPDVDETYKKALQAGASSAEEPADQDYGDRRAAFSDPAGNTWYVATNHVHESDMDR